MRWRWAVVCALILCGGCATEGSKSEWSEFWKDLRGDNMQMQSDRELGVRHAPGKADN